MEARVILVDDHEMFRAGLRSLLEREPGVSVVGEAQDGRTALEVVKASGANIVVMDLRMPNLNGVDATSQVLAANPEMKVIGLSGNHDEETVLQMFRAGAAGYVVKEGAFEELATAIRTVMDGNVYLSPAIARIMVHDIMKAPLKSADSPFSSLSPREREVLQLIAEGRATKQIAMLLKVSVKTAETHRRNLMGKLQMDSVAELTRYAVRNGLVTA